MFGLLRRHRTARATLIGLLSALSSVLPNCASAQAAEAASSMRTVTDLLGRKVNVRVPVRRVILGEGRQPYLVAALDKENPLQHIVGWRKDLIQADPEPTAPTCGHFPRSPAFRPWRFRGRHIRHRTSRLATDNPLRFFARVVVQSQFWFSSIKTVCPIGYGMRAAGAADIFANLSSSAKSRILTESTDNKVGNFR